MKKRILLISSIILLIPVLLYEYFVLIWFWGGDGIFTLFAIPIIFIILLSIQIYLKKRHTLTKMQNIAINLFIAFLTPLLSMLIVWLIALFLGINIVIA